MVCFQLDIDSNVYLGIIWVYNVAKERKHIVFKCIYKLELYIYILSGTDASIENVPIISF